MDNGNARAATEQRAPWLPKALMKLESCAEAPPGWDSYGGLPLLASVHKEAERLLRLIEKEPLPVPAVVLGSGGTVQFEWHCDGRQLEVEVLEDGTLGYLKVFPDEEMQEGDIDSDVDRQWCDLVAWLLHG